MKIVVNRFYSDKEATLSTISVDNKFICFGLEDEFRSSKVYGETRIPSGKYEIGIRKEGGFHNRYSEKFKDFHKGMIQIKDVPNFEYILFHIGNYEKDTAGCILVGKNSTTSGTPTVLNSTTAYKEFYSLVIEEAIKGNVTIEIIDNDRG